MEQKHGGNIYQYPWILDFSANVNPYGPPEAVKEAVRASVEQAHRYPDPSFDKLRNALAKEYNKDKSNFIVGNGAADLIFAICRAVKPKKSLLVEPFFLEYEKALLAEETEIVYYQTRAEEGFCLRKDFVDEITEEIELIFLCNPNNPTGAMIEHHLLLEILKRCQETGTILVLDECFNEFVMGAMKHTLMPQVEEFSNLFILKAFTKLYGMPGIRLGFGVTSNLALLEKIERVSQPWGISVMAEAAGIAALQEKEFVAESLKAIEHEKRRMIIILAQAGYLIYESAANYIFFEAEEGLAEKCLKRGIMIRDCSGYKGLRNGYYRVAVRKPKDNDRLVNVLLEGK